MGLLDLEIVALDIESLHRRLRRAAVSDVPALLDEIGQLEHRARSFGVPELNAAVKMRRAVAYLRLSRPADALEQTTLARQDLGDRRQHDLLVHMLAIRADALAALGRTRDLRDVCAEAITLIEAHRYDVGNTYLQSAYLTSRIGIYTHAVRAAYECGDQADLLAKAELSKARVFLRRGRQTAVSPELLADFRRACAEVDRAAAGEGRVDAATLQRRRVLAELVSAERSRGVQAPSFDLQALRRALPADRAAISYYWLDRTTLLITVIDSDGAVTESRILTPQQRAELEELAESILTFGATSARSIPGLVSKWFDVLWPSPALRPRLEGRRLSISLHRILHALPLHAMKYGGTGGTASSSSLKPTPSPTFRTSPALSPTRRRAGHNPHSPLERPSSSAPAGRSIRSPTPRSKWNPSARSTRARVRRSSRSSTSRAPSRNSAR